MGAKAIVLANPYTYKFLKGLTHSALDWSPNHLIKDDCGSSALLPGISQCHRKLPFHFHRSGDCYHLCGVAIPDSMIIILFGHFRSDLI